MPSYWQRLRIRESRTVRSFAQTFSEVDLTSRYRPQGIESGGGKAHALDPRADGNKTQERFGRPINKPMGKGTRSVREWIKEAPAELYQKLVSTVLRPRSVNRLKLARTQWWSLSAAATGLRRFCPERDGVPSRYNPSRARFNELVINDEKSILSWLR